MRGERASAATGRKNEATSATVAAQTTAAVVTCPSTSHQGRRFRYWISPIAICRQTTPSTPRVA
jgi:hypothetical protein